MVIDLAARWLQNSGISGSHSPEWWLSKSGQVALGGPEYRYGKERGIEVSGYRPAIADANEIANGLDSTLKYYRRWIDKGNALPMLARFFNR